MDQQCSLQKVYIALNVTVTCTCMYTGVLSKWVLTKLLGKSLNDYWVSSMLLYEKHLMLSVFFSNNHLTDNAPHLQNCSPCLKRAQCYCLCSADSSQAFHSLAHTVCPTIIQLIINYVLCQNKSNKYRGRQVSNN